MNIRTIARILPVALTVAVFSACEDKSSGLGEAFAIVTSNSVINTQVGSSFNVNAQVIDRLFTPLPIRVNAVNENSNVIAIDSVTFDTDLLETRIFGRALASGQSRIFLSARSLADTVVVNVTQPGT